MTQTWIVQRPNRHGKRHFSKIIKKDEILGPEFHAFCVLFFISKAGMACFAVHSPQLSLLWLVPFEPLFSLNSPRRNGQCVVPLIVFRI
jgi:hypothetical protein